MPSDPFKFGVEEPLKKTRQNISKTEWDVIKTTHGNKCILCGKTDKSCGGLEKAHIKAASKSGTTVLPMCPTCHKKFDKGLATDANLKKLGLTRAQYNRIIPKPGPKPQTEKPQDFEIPQIVIPEIDIPNITLSPPPKSPKKRK